MVSEAAGPVKIRSLSDEDRPWAASFLSDHAGSPVQAAHGQLHHCDQHLGFYALRGEVRVGIATYVLGDGDCEMSALFTADQWTGVGTSLVRAVRDAARDEGCRRLWLITTNDNVDAIRFYQRRGFRLAAVHAGAVDESRRTLKPAIPEVGQYGISIRDELEFELLID